MPVQQNSTFEELNHESLTDLIIRHVRGARRGNLALARRSGMLVHDGSGYKKIRGIENGIPKCCKQASEQSRE